MPAETRDLLRAKAKALGRVSCPCHDIAVDWNKKPRVCQNGSKKSPGVALADFAHHCDMWHLPMLNPLHKGHATMLESIHTYCGADYGVCTSCTRRKPVCGKNERALTRWVLETTPKNSRWFHVDRLVAGTSMCQFAHFGVIRS